MTTLIDDLEIDLKTVTLNFGEDSGIELTSYVEADKLISLLNTMINKIRYLEREVERLERTKKADYTFGGK